MKVGSLIYDDYYGNGIVTEVWVDEGVVVWFSGPNKFCFLDDLLASSVEVINEGG